MSGKSGAERSDKVGSLTAGVLTRQLERMRPALIEPAPEVSKSPECLKKPPSLRKQARGRGERRRDKEQDRRDKLLKNGVAPKSIETEKTKNT